MVGQWNPTAQILILYATRSAYERAPIKALYRYHVVSCFNSRMLGWVRNPDAESFSVWCRLIKGGAACRSPTEVGTRGGCKQTAIG